MMTAISLLASTPFAMPCFRMSTPFLIRPQLLARLLTDASVVDVRLDVLSLRSTRNACLSIDGWCALTPGGAPDV
jgi:hypothetical protein